MNYELSKQLKDAGFHQSSREWYFDSLHRQYVCGFIPWNEEACAVPTLSQLIYACGPGWKFERTHAQAGWYVKMRGIGVTQCATPEEAVAKLWLALHQN